MRGSDAVAVVTGASGHLGNALVRRLLEAGYEVRALVQAGDDAVGLAGLPLVRCPGDVLDRAGLERAFDGAGLVFHLAGLVSITRGGEGRLFEVNVEGTRRVVAACRARGVGRLVHVGSVHALDAPASGDFDETAGFHPVRAPGPYARTKAQACVEVEAAVARGELDAVLVLPTGVLGPWDFRLSEMGQLVVALAEGRVPLLVEGGHDWVDVRDVAQGMLLAARRGEPGGAYLLGGGWRSLREVAALLSGRRPPPALPAWAARLAALPAPLWEAVTGRRALLTPYAVDTLTSPARPSSARARAALGFAPRPLEATLADTLAWHHQSALSPGNRHLAAPGPARAGALTR